MVIMKSTFKITDGKPVSNTHKITNRVVEKGVKRRKVKADLHSCLNVKYSVKCLHS